MKEKERDNEEILLGMVSHILSFTIGEFCKYGYTLSFERELADLKGLVRADSIYENDLELLASIKDPPVKLLLRSIHKVADHLKTYFLINQLDEMEVMLDEQCHQHASDNFYYYVNEGIGTNYKMMLLETHDLYFSVMHMIFHTAYQLRLKEVDLPEEIFDTFYFDFLDVLDCNLKTEDKNIQLLYDLIVEINDDAIALGRLI
jgi:hypothetical protein